MGEISYKALREIQQKEFSSPKLSQLDDDFYAAADAFIKQKKDEAFSSNSILRIREFENLQKIVAAIKEKREEKIVLMALRGEKVNGFLTPQEKALFDKLASVLAEFRSSTEAATDKKSQDERLKVKIIKDIEAYKGLDGNIYGPYKQDEITLLPKTEVEWLIKAKMAEMLVTR